MILNCIRIMPQIADLTLISAWKFVREGRPRLFERDREAYDATHQWQYPSPTLTFSPSPPKHRRAEPL